jgi:hypothetical protein
MHLLMQRLGRCSHFVKKDVYLDKFKTINLEEGVTKFTEPLREKHCLYL